MSVKDCLRYTIEHEAGHDSGARAEELEATLDELRLWWKDSRQWVFRKVTGRSRASSPGTPAAYSASRRHSLGRPEAYELSDREPHSD